MADSPARQEALPTGPAENATAFGVYVHWPFCAAKCPYCDFNSHVRHGRIDEARFAAAFTREIASIAERVPGRQVSKTAGRKALPAQL